MEDNLKTYINFSSIHLKQVKKLKKVKLPIYKDKKLSYKRYKRISKKCFLEETNKLHSIPRNRNNQRIKKSGNYNARRNGWDSKTYKKEV